MADFRIPGPRIDAARRTWLLAWVVSALVIVVAGLSAGVQPFGIGGDTDDALRFLQLRDLLEGQGWGDVTQSRLGVEGTPLHWSRLPDLPYLVLAWPLSWGMGADTALRIAGSVVLLLMWGAVVWAMLRAIGAAVGSRLGGLEAVAVAAIPAMAFAPRFGFGSFDHHNVQLLCLAFALAATMARPTRRMGAVAGLALAGSALVGLETAPTLVYLCGVWALWWAVEPLARREATTAFGMALAGGVTLGGLVFAADFEMGSTLCDAFGVGVGGALLLGGGGLAIAAMALSERPLVLRGLGLGAIGLVVVAFILLASPQCLANPLDVMPGDVRELWLGNVQEARGLFAEDIDLSMRAFVAGVPLAALTVAGMAAVRMEGRRRTLALVLAGWLGLALAMTVYQIRFQSLALVPASVVMGAALVAALRWDTEPVRRLIAVALAAMLGSSLIWSGLAVVGGDLLDGDAERDRLAEREADAASDAAAALCTSPDVLARLDQMEPGFVFAHFNHADEILLHTHHRALASNYHRGWRDIATHIALERLGPEAAAEGLRASGVDYVFACAGADGEIRPMFGFEGSFLSGLGDGVAGLDAVDLGLPEGVAVYAVR